VLARLKAIEAEAAVRWPALAQISEHESKAEVEIARLNAETAARVAAEVASNGFWLTLYRSIAMYAATLNLIGFGLTFFYGMYLDQALWGRIVEGRDVVAWWIGAMASVLGLHFFSRAQERKAAVTVTREAACAAPIERRALANHCCPFLSAFPKTEHPVPRDNDYRARSWAEYRRMILQELDRLNTAVNALSAKIDDIRRHDLTQLRIDVTMLQVKAGLWGAVAGLIAAIAAVLTRLVT
jgi:hypothetical protein